MVLWIYFPIHVLAVRVAKRFTRIPAIQLKRMGQGQSIIAVTAISITVRRLRPQSPA